VVARLDAHAGLMEQTRKVVSNRPGERGRCGSWWHEVASEG